MLGIYQSYQRTGHWKKVYNHSLLDILVNANLECLSGRVLGIDSTTRSCNELCTIYNTLHLRYTDNYIYIAALPLWVCSSQFSLYTPCRIQLPVTYVHRKIIVVRICRDRYKDLNYIIRNL